jgi:23S rRNA pseudouridine1911/1915/1917 synthase
VTNESSTTASTTKSIETTGRDFVVEPGAAGRRLDVWLAERLGIGRAGVRKLLEAGVVSLDGRPLERRDKSAPTEAGSHVVVAGFAAPDARRAIAEPALPLVVLASGAGWIAIDKPAGAPVHPLRTDETGTLLNALIARHPEVHGVGEGGLRSGVAHRLDVHTSGVVLFGTDEATWQRLRDAFRSHRVEKVYRALVRGRLEGEGDLRVSLAVARHRPALVRVVPASQAGSRRTALSWRALAHGKDVTLVEVRPRTGFLHQIRATLAHLGHPLCGDATYAAGIEGEDTSGAQRHLLHAARVTVDEIEAESPDAADFAEACARLLA